MHGWPTPREDDTEAIPVMGSFSAEWLVPKAGWNWDTRSAGIMVVDGAECVRVFEIMSNEVYDPAAIS